MRKVKENTEKKDEMDLNKLNSTATRVVYWTFQVLILCTMMFSLVALFTEKVLFDKGTHIEHIMLCVVSLVLYNIPAFVQKKFKLYIPSTIQIFVLIFIFAHFVLGEIFGAYKVSAVFDKILHTTSGLAIALGGFSLVNILNDSRKTHMKLSPLFVAFFSFCFALAIALLWEILEYTADSLFGTNMQRYMPPANLAKPEPPKQGYGLIDTMGDIIVSTVAAFVVSVLGYIALKKKAQYLNRFLLRKIPDYDTAIAEAEELGDTKLAEALKKARDEALKNIGGGGLPESSEKKEEEKEEEPIDGQEEDKKSDPVAEELPAEVELSQEFVQAVQSLANKNNASAESAMAAFEEESNAEDPFATDDKSKTNQNE